MYRFVSRATRALVALSVGALVLVVAAPAASAHEVRPVGAYTFTVGWEVEPTYTGVLNAVQLFLKDSKGNPVDDLGTPPTLQVTATTGSQTSAPLDLEPSFDPDTGLGTHGEFDAPLVPTVPGTYSFHFTGTVNGQTINQTFTSSDSTFDNVVDPSAIEFPTQPPSNAELATNASRLTTRVGTALSDASSGQNTARTAETLAVVALVVAVVVGLGGVSVGLSARRKRGLSDGSAD